jgi:hypothetical protein
MEGLGGLYNKSRAPLRRVRKVNVKIMDTDRRLQHNPLLGEFRISAALKQQLGSKLSPRSCGWILALNRKLSAEFQAEAKTREKKPMPFRASYRPEYCSVDIRYLTKKEQNLQGVDVAYYTLLSVGVKSLQSHARTLSDVRRTRVPVQCHRAKTVQQCQVPAILPQVPD